MKSSVLVVKQLIKCLHNAIDTLWYKRSISNCIIRSNIKSMKDWCLEFKNGEIGIVKFIHKNKQGTEFGIQVFDTKENLFVKPVESSSAGIYKVKNVTNLKIIKLQDIFSKMMILLYKSSYVAMVLIPTTNKI